MIYGTDSAYPDPLRSANNSYSEPSKGVEIRTYLAGLALQGILASAYPTDGLTKQGAYSFVNDSVFLADELIKVLNQDELSAK